LSRTCCKFSSVSQRFRGTADWWSIGMMILGDRTTLCKRQVLWVAWIGSTSRFLPSVLFHNTEPASSSHSSPRIRGPDVPTKRRASLDRFDWDRYPKKVE
jgi:hypothetical protein